MNSSQAQNSINHQFWMSNNDQNHNNIFAMSKSYDSRNVNEKLNPFQVESQQNLNQVALSLHSSDEEEDIWYNSNDHTLEEKAKDEAQNLLATLSNQNTQYVELIMKEMNKLKISGELSKSQQSSPRNNINDSPKDVDMKNNETHTEDTEFKNTNEKSYNTPSLPNPGNIHNGNSGYSNTNIGIMWQNNYQSPMSKTFMNSGQPNYSQNSQPKITDFNASKTLDLSKENTFMTQPKAKVNGKRFSY